MAIVLPEHIKDFYERDVLRFDYVQGRRGIALDTTIDTSEYGGVISDPSLAGSDLEGIGEKVRGLYDSVQVVKTTIDGREITTEMGILPGVGKRVKVHDATYSSSLVVNPGNGFEIARDAYYDPDVTHVYMGAPGIGGSTGYSPEEQRYLRKYGRLLVDDSVANRVTALPLVRARAKVLQQLGLDVTDLHSDSAGALLSLAYGAVYGGGQIETSHQNVRPGVKDIGPFALALGMLYLDGAISKKHAAVSPDLMKMGPDKLALVKANVSDAYRQKAFTKNRDTATLLANLVGLGRGPYHGDPLVADNIAFAYANPDARILFTLGSEDPLTKREDIADRMDAVCRKVSLFSNNSVNAVVFEGMSHNIQTHYPQYLRAISRFILG
ncbi:MAG: hypothetical protein WBO35_05145 [Candidatus Saccharimonadales bacterium]|jgi:hypothetical protein